MTNKGMERETKNLSDATREVKCRELAVLDWSKTPSAQVHELMGRPSWQTISNYRETPEYKETLEELRLQWMETVKRLPNSSELRQKITYGMGLSLDRLIEILVPEGKATYKDRISAARLMAQLDGRFLRGEDDSDPNGKTVDSVAQELLTAIKRQDRVN